jgi:penicillin-binding protein 2
MFHIFRKKKRRASAIDPDEIFIDARNLPEFNTHQFEGRIETPLSSKTFLFLALAFFAVIFIFIFQLWGLEVRNTEHYRALSETNRLRNTFIFPERGIIRDTQGVSLVWNIANDDTSKQNMATTSAEHTVLKRAYIDTPGLAHILGYIGYPLQDSAGNYYQEETIGKAGIEEYYNELLRGQNGVTILETNAVGEKISGSVIQSPVNGETLSLTIDSRIQTKLYSFMESLATERGFVGGAGVILSVDDGGILALANFPEFSSSILTEGEDSSTINHYLMAREKPFLNRAISGLYTPGSIVKPFVAVGALNEHIIDPNKEILSTGSISLPNPFAPENKSIFTDWKAHGLVDIKKALAVSSNVYFYEVGGGFEDQAGLGIAGLEKYFRLFGLGETTGVDLNGEENGTLPNPEWKQENFVDGEWRIGDTYNTAIGQYGVQVTPLQMARAIAAIANNGFLLTPHVLKSVLNAPEKPVALIDQNALEIVREGMREAVLSGTAKGLDILQTKIAAKTGTAELGTIKANVNSWIVGFFPYEKPRYAFAVVMEKGRRENTIGALYVMRQLFDWMAQNTPEYLQ